MMGGRLFVARYPDALRFLRDGMGGRSQDILGFQQNS